MGASGAGSDIGAGVCVRGGPPEVPLQEGKSVVGPKVT